VFKKNNYYFYVFAILSATYAVLVLALPVRKLVLEYYHISLLGLRFIELTYLVPQILIWSAAFYGFSKIKEYSKSISKYKDGQEIKYIGFGIGALAIGGPFNAVISTILNAITQYHARLIPTVTIINNYLSVILAIIAVLLIGKGAYGLMASINARTKYRELLILSIIYVIVVGGFCYLVFHKLPSSLSFGISNKPIYYLPNWLLLFTLVVPYTFVWFIGGYAVLNIRAYQQKVKGIIYKRSMLFLELGITLIIISLVLLQYLTTVSAKLATLKILPLLLIIYPILALVALGYISVAYGAKKLKKIEES